MQIGDVEAADRLMGTGGGGIGAAHVAAAAATDALVAAGAERVRALAGEDDHADLGILPGALERVGQLDHRLGSKRVADLGPVDRDLGDAGVIAGRQLVADVGVLAAWLPAGAQRLLLSCSGKTRTLCQWREAGG